jgi:proton-dependent oligopeptide transporter, POT family
MNFLFKTLRDKIKANPTGVYVLFYTEMWELFGRFGITALLVLYFTGVFHISDARAFEIYSAFIALVYATPIFGGVLADRYLGSRNAIILGGLLMIVGDALMVIPRESAVFIGLSIVAVGSGFFLPAIPPLVGALYEKNDRGRDAGFTLYYLGKNIGALLAPIACGFVGQAFGINYAFVLSTIGMLSGVFVFMLGQKHLKGFNRKPRFDNDAHKLCGIKPKTFIYLVIALMVPLVLLILTENIDGYLLAITAVIVAVYLAVLYSRQTKKDRQKMQLIFLSIAAVIVFEAFLGQGGTTLNLFIKRLVDRHFAGLHIPTAAFYSLDPIFMLLIGPFLAGLWMRLSRKKREPIVTTKYAIALFLLGLGFLVFVKAASVAALQGSASPLYVVLAYCLFPIGELCIIPISLSLVTKMAPKGLDSLLVGVWMLSNAASSVFTGWISMLGQVSFSRHANLARVHAAHIYMHVFLGTAIVLIGVSVILLVCKPFVQKRLRAGNAVSTQ